MPEVSTHIAINAPPAKVWAVLMDFARYDKWNPFITQIEGEANPGRTLHVILRFADKKPMQITPMVIKAADSELIWRGKIFITGIFDGEHYFRVEASETGCVFHHYEHFSGILPMFMGKGFYASVKERFVAMNQALKTRTEMLGAAGLATGGLKMTQ